MACCHVCLRPLLQSSLLLLFALDDLEGSKHIEASSLAWRSVFTCWTKSPSRCLGFPRSSHLNYSKLSVKFNQLPYLTHISISAHDVLISSSTQVERRGVITASTRVCFENRILPNPGHTGRRFLGQQCM